MILALSIAATIALQTPNPEWLPIIKTAYERYEKSTSVTGELTVEDFGQNERWAFTYLPSKFFELVTPNRVYQSTPGKYVIYHPRTHSGTVTEIEKEGFVVLRDLWPFHNLGQTSSMGFGMSSTMPRKGVFNDKTAWEMPDITVTNGKASLFFGLKSGDLLGWIETNQAIGRTRKFMLNQVTWNSVDASSCKALFTIPKDMKTESDDAKLFLPPGQALPNTQLIDEKGNKATIAKLLKGSKGAIVSLGTPGCGPCEALKKAVAQIGPQMKVANVRFIALETLCTQEKLKELAKDTKLPFPTYIRDGLDDFSQRFSAGGFPTVYVLDEDGTVIKAMQGYDADWLKENLEALGVRGI